MRATLISQSGSGDSDDQLPALKSIATRRVNNGRKTTVVGEKSLGSSGESDHEEYVSALKAGNFADLVNDSFYLKETEQAKNIRVVNRQRPSTLLRPSSGVVKPLGSFVPKEVKNGGSIERISTEFKPKSMRINGAGSSKRENSTETEESRKRKTKTVKAAVIPHYVEPEEEKLPDAWAKAPKKFLEPNEDLEQDSQQSSLKDNSRGAAKGQKRGKDWAIAKTNRNRDDDDEGDYEQQKAIPRRSDGRRAKDVDDLDDDVVSKSSADTIAEDYPPKTSTTAYEFNPNKNAARDFDEFDDPVIPSRINNNKLKSNASPNKATNRLKDVFQRSAEEEEEEAFLAYANQKESQGVLLPRKSGRYEDYNGTGSYDKTPSADGINTRTKYGQSQQQNQIAYKGNKYRSTYDEDEREPGDDTDEIETFALKDENFNHQYRQPPGDHHNKKPTGLDHRDPNQSNSGGGWFSSLTGSGKNKNQLRSSNQSNTTSAVAGTNISTNSSLNSTYNAMAGKHSFVLIAHPHGIRSRMVQCTIVRDRSSIHGKLYPSYELILDEPKKSLIIARKMSMNRTSNYHLFDMTRGAVSNKLSKKAGNYLGKLRAKNMQRTGYSLLTPKEDEQNREEIAGILFDRITFMDQIQDGNQPRKMKVLVPLLNEDSIPLPIIPSQTYGMESLPEMLQLIDEEKLTLPNDLRLLHTKEPVFENGNYRLNFHGRVSMPSVKNFQMVPHDDIHDVVCQFGKVEKDVFHLDYREPFNAVQAFALALCQFNL